MTLYDELAAKLREMFQIDQPDLDFGVYRIMGARRAEIEAYLTTRLRARVDEALAAGAAGSTEMLERELVAQWQAYAADGIPDIDNLPRIRTLRDRIAAARAGQADADTVFSHLLTFFGRYYESGDFISQRRYKGDTYAIPYAGEEVVLHWANKDQYYVKSGERFSTYAFRLDDGRRVVFALAAADTARDNRRDVGARLFVLAQPRPGVAPVAERDGELVLSFDYREFPRGTRQDQAIAESAHAILADPTVQARWPALAMPAPTDARPDRVLLERHLAAYATKNTADYFIHKNLGGFLSRELDHYIKTEVINLDDVASAADFAPVEARLRIVIALRGIARDLIAFMASLEDFQKKLWLKRKFVVSADYVLTLDRVPEHLLPSVAANARQWANWAALGVREDPAPGTHAEFSAHPAWMVDTALFDAAFRAELLRALPDLDESIDGVCVQGDNFQALRLLEERYRGQVTDSYNDPPYNTDSAPIIYKNGFKESSWLAMFADRFRASQPLTSENMMTCTTIDDVEMHRLQIILEEITGGVALGVVAIKNNPAGRMGTVGFSTCHEYALFFGSHELSGVGRLNHSETQRSRYKHQDELGSFEWTNFRKHGGTNTFRTTRPRQFYPIYVTQSSLRVPEMEWDNTIRDWRIFDQLDVGETLILPIDDRGRERIWDFVPDTAKENIEHLRVQKDSREELAVYRKWRINPQGLLPQTIWDSAKMSAAAHGTNLLASMFGLTQSFSFPKSVYAVADCLRVCGCGSSNDRVVLDYFAGSGTTAHAVIMLNRADNGRRKYILVEQGAYFDTVLTPRIQKTVFSADWRDGKPTSSATGISHAFKRLRIEGYEDTLNNLSASRPTATDDLLARMPPQAADEYRMRYALDVETRGALLGQDRFAHPFDAQMDIATETAGARYATPIDLVETFNLLIGLHVDRIDLRTPQGWASVTGTLPGGERALVLWRDYTTVNDHALRALVAELRAVPGDCVFDRVYINGDHTLPTALTTGDGTDAVTHRVRYEAIEPAFLSAMFDAVDP